MLADHMQHVVASMESDEQKNQEEKPPGTSEQEPEPVETIHIHYFPDAIIILKEGEDNSQENTPVETTLATPTNEPYLAPIILSVFFLLVSLFSILLQVSLALNPPIATITIIPKSQHVTLTGTLQLGRIIAPITVSQSQTTPTTGRGYQNARQATGMLTFYNGSFSEQTMYAGTVFTGADGVKVVTDETVTIPAANPPKWGIATVSAHALNTGSQGNIQALDIASAVSNDVSVKNLTVFSHGQDERNFQTVAKSDIDNTAKALKITLAQSLTGALQGQGKPGEQLVTLPCTPTVTTDHAAGDEATVVKITVSEMCSAVAYNEDQLITQATELLATRATKNVKAGYSLIGDVHVTVKQATITHTSTPLVLLSFSCQGTWVYAVTITEQQRMQTLITGRTRQKALQILSSLPGIERVSTAWDENTKLPKDPRYIHFVVMYTA